MKKFLLATFALCAVASTAVAADLPVKAPPPLPPAYSWTGCYGGITAGYSDHHATFSNQDAYSSDWSGWSNGFIGGGELGCNLQYDSFVYGIEGDISGLTNNGHFDGGYYGDYQWKMDWLATLRLRSGLAVGKTMLYLTLLTMIGQDRVRASDGSSGRGLRGHSLTI